MASQNEEVKTLTRLGLSFCQARVYLALVQSGTSTTRTISKVSKVTQQDVYRIMPTLQELGLAEKIITSPAMFKAASIQDAVSILLERRIKQTSELQAETRELVKNLVKKKAKPTLQEEAQQLVLVPAKEVAIHMIRDAIKTAQNSIDVVTLWSRFSSAIFAYTEEYKKSLKRGVKMRHVTERPDDKESLACAREIARNFKEYPSFKVKYFRTLIKTVVAIIDKKKVFIFTSPSPELGGSPILLSNNPCLIELAQNYFDIVWITAMEEIPEEHWLAS